MTVASNQFQNHNQLLRHGMLNWVTRGVYLGYERNYLELDVDDIFLPDDKWDPVANVTDYSPEAAIRMTPADVDNAVAWQRQTGLRAEHGLQHGRHRGVRRPATTCSRRCRANKNEFRWINHTLQHPNLDCTHGERSSRTRSRRTRPRSTRSSSRASRRWSERSDRGRHGRALRARQHPSGQPRARSTRRCSTTSEPAGDGRHARGRHLRVRRDRQLDGHRRDRRRRLAQVAVAGAERARSRELQRPSATRSPTTLYRRTGPAAPGRGSPTRPRTRQRAHARRRRTRARSNIRSPTPARRRAPRRDAADRQRRGARAVPPEPDLHRRR